MRWVISVEYVRKTGEKNAFRMAKHVYVFEGPGVLKGMSSFPDFIRRERKRAEQCEWHRPPQKEI